MPGRRLSRLAARFWRDDRGAFGIIFAVMAIVIVALAGSAVDFTGLEQARNRAQVALDAASLALQPSIYTATAASIQTQAQTLLTNELSSGGMSWANCANNGQKAPCAAVQTPVPDIVNGQLTLAATIKVPMYFVSLVGIPTISASVVSAATRKKLALEVAMVLDNSGSMATGFGSGSRMSVLQASAKCAANILFYNVTSCSASTAGITPNAQVKIGLVPFTMEVNVGTANANASWMDRSGTSTDSITADNFDSDDYDGDIFTGPVDRISLFNGISYNGSPLSWGGCVEARKAPYDVNDTQPDPSTPDTMFTPLFAPDEPGSTNSPGSGVTTNGDKFYNSYIADTGPTCNKEPVVVYTQQKTQCSKAATDSTSYSNSCTGTTTNSYVETDQTGATSTISSLPSSIFNNPLPSTPSNTSYSYASTNNGYTNTRVQTYTYIFSNREYQERLCKYNGAVMKYAPNVGSAYGPNSDCPANAVQPLTNEPSDVMAAISAMSAQGGTNITEGTAWGWRVLSPTPPFTEGTAYDGATSKVMIVMTDGENTAYQYSNMNDAQFYSAYGFPWNSTEHSRPANTRIGTPTWSTTQLDTEMNNRLATVCTNAKAEGITIYTIGIATSQTSNPSANQALLTNCATDSSKAYFPTTATDLQNAFVSIANQLSALRLAQ